MIFMIKTRKGYVPKSNNYVQSTRDNPKRFFYLSPKKYTAVLN